MLPLAFLSLVSLASPVPADLHGTWHSKVGILLVIDGPSATLTDEESLVSFNVSLTLKPGRLRMVDQFGTLERQHAKLLDLVRRHPGFAP